MRLTSPESPERSACASHPLSASLSKLISNGFPAKAEVEEYGEFPLAGGFRGSTCHNPCRADARKSRNSYAPGPKSPIPPREGNEIGCSRIPVERGNDISTYTSIVICAGATRLRLPRLAVW